MNNRNNFFRTKYIVLILFVSSFVFYLPTLWHNFVWDDLQVLSSEINAIKGYGLFLGGGDYYRPFLALAHGLDYALWYTNPIGFHLTNIILNALCGIGSFFVFRYFLRGSAPFLPVFASLFFILHPVHSDSVAWIAGRTDIIAALFFMPALLSYILFREENDSRILFLCSLFFLFSLFGKEIGIAFPLIALCYDILIVQRKIKQILFAQAPLWLVVVIYFIIRKMPRPDIGLASNIQSTGIEATGSSLWLYIQETVYSFGFYIYKLLVPFNLSMFPDIHRTEYLTAAVVLLVLLILAVMKKSRITVFGVLFIILTILPSIPVIFMKNVPSPVAVRYLYLPVFGFALISVHIIDQIKSLYLKTSFFVILLVVYIIGGTLRNMDWKDNLSLWSNEVKVNSDSAVAHELRGHALLTTKSYDDAEKEMLHVIANIDSLRKNESIRKKIMGDCLNSLGIISINRQELDIAKAYLLEALKYSKKNKSIYHNLGSVYLSLYYNNKKDKTLLKNANLMYKNASEIDSNYINSKYGLAYTSHLLGNREDALKQYEDVINTDPRSPLAVRAAKGIASIRNKEK